MKAWINTTTGFGTALSSLFAGTGAIDSSCPVNGACSRPAPSSLILGALGLSTLLRLAGDTA